MEELKGRNREREREREIQRGENRGKGDNGEERRGGREIVRKRETTYLFFCLFSLTANVDAIKTAVVKKGGLPVLERLLQLSSTSCKLRYGYHLHK